LTAARRHPDDVYVIRRNPTMSMPGRMVREARRRANLTQRQLSAKASIPQETIARIERGRVDPRVTTLDRLLAACGFGLESMPRLGIGIDRTQIHERLSVSMEKRLAVAMAEDAHFVSWRGQPRRVAE
jgi:transcriptional regulator with XRE-family HTH domain